MEDGRLSRKEPEETIEVFTSYPYVEIYSWVMFSLL